MNQQICKQGRGFIYVVLYGWENSVVTFFLLSPENNKTGAFYVTGLSHLPSEEARNSENSA